MTGPIDDEQSEFSLLTFGTMLLRNRRKIFRCIFAGAVLMGLSVVAKPALYKASASFVPQGQDAGRSGLASLAGQLGVAIPTGNQSQSTDFYMQLMKSRVVLRKIVLDTIVVAEIGGQRTTLLDVFKIDAPTRKAREERGVQALQQVVVPSVTRTTGVVEVSATTEWPSVSLQIVTALVNGVGEFNQRTRQGQATEERRFVEGRLAVASTDLRQAEDRLEQFMLTNRMAGASISLTLDQQRLQRDVDMKQQMFSALMQGYDDVRIREVRDTPVITIIDPPTVPSQPEPRGRVKSVIFGGVLGAFVGILLIYASESFGRRRRDGDAEAGEFAHLVKESTGSLSASVRRLWLRVRR
jgi:hypothetical protein